VKRIGAHDLPSGSGGWDREFRLNTSSNRSSKASSGAASLVIFKGAAFDFAQVILINYKYYPVCIISPWSLTTGKELPQPSKMHATTHIFLVESQSLTTPRTHSLAFHRPLVLLFLLSLALLNPWVRGDGVGYYAFARAPLIDHSLNFESDYRSANLSFREARLDEYGRPKQVFRTPTGHLDNHFTIGPAMLWAPFLLVAHGGVLLARALGSQVAADGFSAPYRLAMAFGTAFWGFLGLLLAFRIARQYAGDLCAFLATIAIWWASSLPVYMYFNPSWSHAHSAFAASLFLWYWHHTREHRTLRQWCVLALTAGLMLNVYYANVMLLTVLAVEAIRQYSTALRHHFRMAPRRDFLQSPPGSAPSTSDSSPESAALASNTAPLASNTASLASNTAPPITVLQLFARHFVFIAVVAVCLLPTFITRYIIYGNPLESGYGSVVHWAWRSPYFLAVLFSSDHGLFSWTPLLLPAALGLILFRWRDPRVGTPLLAAALAFYVFIACYPDWAGISSYGNRFFISLTPLFILGLSVLLARFASVFRSRRAAAVAISLLLGAFVLWNGAFMFQWGAHLIPARGAISWNQMIRNQFQVVPRQIATHLNNYFFHRRDLMRQIEDRDIDQMKKQAEP
jgi:hypothetical protein